MSKSTRQPSFSRQTASGSSYNERSNSYNYTKLLRQNHEHKKNKRVTLYGSLNHQGASTNLISTLEHEGCHPPLMKCWWSNSFKYLCHNSTKASPLLLSRVNLGLRLRFRLRLGGSTWVGLGSVVVKNWRWRVFPSFWSRQFCPRGIRFILLTSF